MVAPSLVVVVAHHRHCVLGAWQHHFFRSCAFLFPPDLLRSRIILRFMPSGFCLMMKPNQLIVLYPISSWTTFLDFVGEVDEVTFLPVSI